MSSKSQMVVFNAAHSCISFDCRWLSIIFNQSDRNRSGALSFDECCHALSQLNIRVDRAEARRLFTVGSSGITLSRNYTPILRLPTLTKEKLEGNTRWTSENSFLFISFSWCDRKSTKYSTNILKRIRSQCHQMDSLFS